jgi:hypothetical protein
VRKEEVPVLGGFKEAGTSKTQPYMKTNVAWLRPWSLKNDTGKIKVHFEKSRALVQLQTGDEVEHV